MHTRSQPSQGVCVCVHRTAASLEFFPLLPQPDCLSGTEIILISVDSLLYCKLDLKATFLLFLSSALPPLPSAN